MGCTCSSLGLEQQIPRPAELASAKWTGPTFPVLGFTIGLSTAIRSDVHGPSRLSVPSVGQSGEVGARRDDGWTAAGFRRPAQRPAASCSESAPPAEAPGVLPQPHHGVHLLSPPEVAPLRKPLSPPLNPSHFRSQFQTTPPNKIFRASISAGVLGGAALPDVGVAVPAHGLPQAPRRTR